MRALSSVSLSFTVLGLLFFASEAPALQFDSDVPATVREQVQTDLAVVGALRGGSGSALHRKIFGGPVNGSHYTTWFNRRVRQAGMSLCWEDNAVACVLTAWENKIWFSPNFTNFSHPQIARLMVIFHEARHTEAQNGFWPHAKCPKPFLDPQGQEVQSIWTGASLAGEMACDEEAQGAYGTAVIFLKNIAKHCTSCTDKVRMDAELYGEDQLNRITNSIYRRQIADDVR